MIKWIKKKHNDSFKPSAHAASEQPIQEEIVANLPEIPLEAVQNAVQEGEEPKGFFARFKKGLSKTRNQFGEGVLRLLLGKKAIDAKIFEELEELLLQADIGVHTTLEIIRELESELARKELADGDAVFESMKKKLQAILDVHVDPLIVPAKQEGLPFVILMLGMNGAGKTTTIGKLARLYKQQGKKVLLAAGDTFRAAAVQQLQVWGERLQIPVIAQPTGADSASVVFDALQAAIARDVDVLIVDTAGRLHTQLHLIEELKKIKRVMKKIHPLAPQESMLVLDASIGQNALNQARQFHEAIGLTGISMTKLDGTAKGGIVFAIANELGLPFRFLGVGEGLDDLRPFDAKQFVQGIFHDTV